MFLLFLDLSLHYLKIKHHNQVSSKYQILPSIRILVSVMRKLFIRGQSGWATGGIEFGFLIQLNGGKLEGGIIHQISGR